ncbi:MAG: metallopeptidase TldD-related protein [Acidimicrobiales bacterium]
MRVLDAVAGRAEAGVTVTRARRGLTRFANSFIHQNVVDEHVEVSLELTSSGRTAAASTFRVDDDALVSLVERTLRAASLRPAGPGWPGLSSPSPLCASEDVHYDAATAAAGPRERAEAVAAFVAAGGGALAAGFCETAEAEHLFANSAGQRASSRDTSAALDAIHRVDGSDGVASTYSARFADVDAAALGAAAAERARRGARPMELTAGGYEVVLEPRCVAYMMDFFTFYAFNGKAMNEGRSFISTGEGQFDPTLTIWDDATDARHVGPAFDAEGTPKRPFQLVEAGTVRGVCHDRRTAARASSPAATTGHAVPSGEAFGAVATNLFIGASASTGSRSTGRSGAGSRGAGSAGQPPSALVSAVERGLLVSDFWYTRVLDPKTLVVTGLTRNGVFLIERGEVRGAVGNLRFTQSYAAALAPGRVLGVGDDGRLAPGGLHRSLHHAPSLHLAGWNFTGGASG